MSIRIVVSVLCIAFTFGLIGCSMSDDVKEATQTSKDMDGKMNTMIGQTSTLTDSTTNLFGKGRKDLAFERPTARYENIINADGNTEKVLHATALMTSYEFQQWTGTNADTPEKKDEFNEKAMRDILPRMEPLINHNYSPETTLFPSNKWLSAAAVSVTMNEIDPDQYKATALHGIQPESVYSLIIKGLQYKKKSRYTTDIPQYARYVLDMEDEAVFLLQLRHNFFAAMVMSRFTDFATSMTNEALAWFRTTSMWRGDRSLQAEYVSNLVKVQDQGIVWLQQAQETQRVLEMLGYPLQFNSGIMNIFDQFSFKTPTEWAGLPLVDATFSQVNKLVDEMKETHRTEKAAPGPIPLKLIEYPARLTESELGMGLPQKKEKPAEETPANFPAPPPVGPIN